MGWLCRKLLILGLGTFPGTGSDVLVGVLLLCVPPTSAIRLSAVHRLQAARHCKTWQNKVLEPWGELWSIGIPGQRARKKVDLSQLKKQMFFFSLHLRISVCKTWRVLRVEEGDFWFTCTLVPKHAQNICHQWKRAPLWQSSFFAVKNKQIYLFVVNACSRWPEIIHDTQPHYCPNYGSAV